MKSAPNVEIWRGSMKVSSEIPIGRTIIRGTDTILAIRT